MENEMLNMRFDASNKYKRSICLISIGKIHFKWNPLNHPLY